MNDVISDGTVPEETDRAKELIEKLAEKKVQIAGHGQEHELQKNKKSQDKREYIIM